MESSFPILIEYDSMFGLFIKHKGSPAVRGDPHLRMCGMKVQPQLRPLAVASALRNMVFTSRAELLATAC